ncbi:hypothetical protein SNEBB_009929 [Seison nebaliae]|nr:hypothetical protein SNEBB_009929 [Seison nebaliae]
MSGSKTLTFTTIGVMSGSSCDGLDLCLSKFTYDSKENLVLTNCEIILGKTVEYPKHIQADLQSYTLKEQSLNLKDFLKFDRNYCKLIGNSIFEFYVKYCSSINIDVISVHGHTIVHDPTISITYQLGCNGEILIGEVKSHNVEGLSRCYLITNHRIRDVTINNGEGAPLVPILDGATSSVTQNNAIINLGGICNITRMEGNELVGYDMCPCNIIFNDLAFMIGNVSYDQNGVLGKRYEQKYKGFISETTMEYISELFGLRKQKNTLNVRESRLIMMKIIMGLENLTEVTEVEFVGGGTFNNYLLALVKDNSLMKNKKIFFRNEEWINFKESHCFSYLGLLKFFQIKQLRCEKPFNILTSVTNGKENMIVGSIHY